MSELHAAIAEGKPSEILAIESFTVDEYYAFLVANNARCEKIRKEMEKRRG
jgi:predicted secreted Zn-dependent protease